MELNALLRQELIGAVETQIKTEDPPETRKTFERLRSAGYSEEEAKEMLAAVLVVEMHTVVSEGQPFNRERFARLLDNLPALPEEHWD